MSETTKLPELVFCAIGPLTVIAELDDLNIPWFIPDTRLYHPSICVLWREGHA